ncbi:MAG: hypothetical protein AAB503_02220 [Patescibacteria group bacterium]
MPMIFVYGVPKETSEGLLLELMNDYKRIVSGISELHFEQDMVSVFFPTDLMLERPGSEVVIFVRSLYEKSERTKDVIQRIARELGFRTKEYFPNSLVECFIDTIGVDQVFRCWSSYDMDQRFRK